MELTELLHRRRMCRDFRPDPLTDDELDRVLAAARWGPTAGNTWALEFVVLRGSVETAGYWDLTLPAGPRRESFRWPGLLSAPVLLLPYLEPAAYPARYAEDDKAPSHLGSGADAWTVPYWWVDAGAAVMAMLLAAADIGLGALLFGQFGNEERLASHLGVPAGRRAVGTIALGRRGVDDVEGRSAGRARPPLEEIVHDGRW